MSSVDLLTGAGVRPLPRLNSEVTGAGATPNRLALDTSPWQDAKPAVDWEGKPVFPQTA